MKRRFKSLIMPLLLTGLGLGLPPPGARADLIFKGSAGSSDGPVSAMADFQAQNGQISLTLTNLQVGMTSQGQALSGITFRISNPPASSISLQSASGLVVAVDGSGNVTSTGSITVKQGSSNVTYQLGQQTYSGATLPDSHWSVSNPSSPDLIALSGMKPNHMILPTQASFPGFTGSGFDPYFEGPVTFVLSTPGVTSASAIDDVVFNFGTSPNEHTANGVLQPPSAVPEPASVALLGLGGAVSLSFGWFRFRRRQPALAKAVGNRV